MTTSHSQAASPSQRLRVTRRCTTERNSTPPPRRRPLLTRICTASRSQTASPSQRSRATRRCTTYRNSTAPPRYRACPIKILKSSPSKSLYDRDTPEPPDPARASDLSIQESRASQRECRDGTSKYFHYASENGVLQHTSDRSSQTMAADSQSDGIDAGCEAEVDESED